MLVDLIEAELEKQAVARKPTTRIGAHNAGSCARKLWFALNGFQGEPMQGRAIAIFDIGNRVEDAIMQFLESAGVAHIRGSREQDAVMLPELGGRVVPDFFFEHAGEPMIGEIKSMSDFAFQRAERGELDEQYLAQVECYLRAFDVRRGLLLAYRKETSHICEVLVERDDDRWQKVQANVALARQAIIPDRPYKLQVDCEDCGGSGKTPAKGLAHKACNGTGRLPYGPIIPRFPCGYCAYKGDCWGELVQAFDAKGRPVWRLVGDGEAA